MMDRNGNCDSFGMETHQASDPRVRVAIVNYRTADLTIDCLASLVIEREQWPSLEVIVADNASPDGSSDRLHQAISENGWGSWVRVLDLPKNGGFAYGNNAVMKFAASPPPEYFWLLNPDTAVRPGALAGLLAVMAREPKAGMVGSCLEWLDGTQQHSAFRFHTIASELTNNLPLGSLSQHFERWAVAPPPQRHTAQYDWLSGASILVRAETVADIGYMDEEYFLYFEETDYCLTARKHGWECWLSADSHVVHFVGKSTGVTNPSERTARRPDYWFQSRRRYFEKNHGALYALGADIALSASVIASRIAAAMRHRNSGIPDNFLMDLARHNMIASPSMHRKPK